tara:strand:- start:2176 stop:2304 length:129 start_codon:yes stop_codon:yes gene_type:complete
MRAGSKQKCSVLEKYWKEKKGNGLMQHFSGQLIFFSSIKNNN